MITLISYATSIASIAFSLFFIYKSWKRADYFRTRSEAIIENSAYEIEMVHGLLTSEKLAYEKKKDELSVELRNCLEKLSMSEDLLIKSHQRGIDGKLLPRGINKDGSKVLKTETFGFGNYKWYYNKY